MFATYVLPSLLETAATINLYLGLFKAFIIPHWGLKGVTPNNSKYGGTGIFRNLVSAGNS